MSDQTLRTFQTDSRRTAPKDLNTNEELLNWSLGLVGEASELSGLSAFPKHDGKWTENITNEAGDILWYLAGFCDTLEFDLNALYLEAKEKVSREKDDKVFLRLVVRAGAVADYIKKVVFQHHPLARDHLWGLLVSTLTHLLELLMDESPDDDIYQVAEKNLEKLRRRYPTGFTPGASINRES